MTKSENTHKTSATLHPEALELAKRVQKEGQSKEEIKRMAQGISKGIELYKKQQSAKQRERDKAQKRFKKLKLEESESPAIQSEQEIKIGYKVGLISSGSVMTVFASILIFFGLKEWPLALGNFKCSITLTYGLGVLFGCLAALNLHQAYTIHKN